ncbi:MAG: type II and III secretion system protein [Rubricoccaceae bacterium]|nr:type II and III secretion system protein [Rubricoccaceae bacterium]
MNFKPNRPSRARARRITLLGLAVLMLGGVVPEAVAQRVTPPTGRRVLSYVPQDELVSFLPTTPFNEFVRLINPVFLRVTGKALVDPMDRQGPIGVSLNGIHFIDAFELVLARAGLDFRESERYFIIQEAPAQAITTDAAIAGDGGILTAGLGGNVTLPATSESREIRIDAIIFELNANRFRETGTNWATIFGQAQASGQSGSGGSTGGGTGTGSGQNQVEIPRFSVEFGSFFDQLDGYIQSSTDQIDMSVLLGLFRWFENQGYGETVASPSVTVQSGEQGRMQSGSDIPVNLQDFQGNTITQFVSTGIIIDVTPTLISDPAAGENGDDVEFVHLDIKVEKSAGRPTAAGITIDKSDVNTQVLLLDGEQTVIGGLYSTEESTSRKGIPILQDIPLLKYLFSYKTRSVIQKELVIVLQARVVESLPNRAGRPLRQNLYQEERRTLRERLDRFRPRTGEEFDTINDDDRETYDLPNN